MPRTLRRPLAALLALVVLCAAAGASELKLNGQTSATLALGAPLSVTLKGAPGKPAFVLADATPGPTLFGGESVPLGFTPALFVAFGGVVPAGGTLAVGTALPVQAELAGLTVHFAGVVLDPADANGKDWSNGASLAIVLEVGAGAPQAVVLGRRVTLDGGEALGAGGGLPPGTAIAWSVVSQPLGSAVALQGAGTVTPVFTPQVAGDYVLRATVSSHTAAYSADTVVHAWDVDLAGLADGSFVSGASVALSGTATGAPLSAVLVDGAASPKSGNTFGPVSKSFAAGEVLLSVLLELRHADGSAARERYTFVQGLPAPFTQPAPLALAARLNQGGLDVAADGGEALLGQADIEGLLLALPDQQIANDEGLFGFTIFSATVDFTGISYDPALQLTLAPMTSGLLGTVTIHDVRADFRVYGEVLEIDYDLDGYITTDPTTITATLTGSAAGGQLHVTVSNVLVDRANFDFELTGFIGTLAEVFVIESAVKEDVEALIAQAVKDQLGPAVEDVLGDFVIAGNLSRDLLVDVDVAAPITAVAHDAAGVTIRLDTTAAVASAEPGAPPVTQYRLTPAFPPALGATSPSGAPYGAGVALADDFLNQVLAAATAAGLLDGDLTSLVPAKGPVTISFLAGDMAVLFPGGGFELFAPETPLTLRAHGTQPPLLLTTPAGPGIGRIHLRNLHVEFEAPGAAGPVPLLLLSLDGHVDMSLDVVDGALSAGVVGQALSIKVLRAFPGASLPVFDANAGFLGAVLEQALPQLVDALGGIPLPSLEAEGLSLVASEAALLGGGTHLGFFGELGTGP